MKNISTKYSQNKDQIQNIMTTSKPQRKFPSRIPGRNTISKYIKRDLEYYKLKEENKKLREKVETLEYQVNYIGKRYSESIEERIARYQKIIDSCAIKTKA